MAAALAILVAFGYMFLSIQTLWIFYLAVMNLRRARDAGTLTVAATVFGYPVLYLGLLIDFLVNIIPVSLLFLEWPQETLVTARLKRHRGTVGWRGSLAEWFAVNLLDPFDPSGRHV